jgi:hypothetical protein
LDVSGQVDPGCRAAALTLGEWDEEYLDAHEGEQVTVTKLVVFAVLAPEPP